MQNGKNGSISTSMIQITWQRGDLVSKLCHRKHSKVRTHKILLFQRNRSRNRNKGKSQTS